MSVSSTDTFIAATCTSFTFVLLQSLLRGLEHRLVELLGEFLWGEAVPGFGASVDGVKALFSLQGERGPQAVQQAGALLGD